MEITHAINWAIVTYFWPNYNPSATFEVRYSTVKVILPKITKFEKEMEDLCSQHW